MIYDKVEAHAAPAADELPGDTEKNPKKKVLTDPKEVRPFMRNPIREIYKHQINLTPEAKNVISFLGANQDQNVLNAIQSKKISNLQRKALEGKLTKQELEHQLMKHMKNTSAPGLDGFTVAWVKTFWEDLSDLCVQAVNDCFDKKNAHKALRNCHHEDTQKRREGFTGS